MLHSGPNSWPDASDRGGYRKSIGHEFPELCVVHCKLNLFEPTFVTVVIYWSRSYILGMDPSPEGGLWVTLALSFVGLRSG